MARVVQNSNVLISVARKMTLTKRRWMDEKCRELALMQEVGGKAVKRALPSHFLW